MLLGWGASTSPTPIAFNIIIETKFKEISHVQIIVDTLIQLDCIPRSSFNHPRSKKRKKNITGMNFIYL